MNGLLKLSNFPTKHSYFKEKPINVLSEETQSLFYHVSNHVITNQIELEKTYSDGLETYSHIKNQDLKNIFHHMIKLNTKYTIIP